MAKIKVGVVGTGFIGPAHIEALRRLPNIEVAALCDSTIESATVKASKIMSEYLDTHLKDMSDHTQLHAFYPFAFGKANRPETSVFPTGSGL
jgi:predicted dehydrogenase